MCSLVDTLDDFAGKLQAHILAAGTAPLWSGAGVQRYMDEFAPRREKFERIAAQVLTEVIRPRLLKLGSFFSNARIDRTPHTDRCVLWFGYSERFPANVTLDFSVEHDECVEHASVLYEVRIMPTFLKFNAHDKLSLSLEFIDDAKFATWVEARLLEFVDTYLQIDRGPADAEDEFVTDPICGMRLNRSVAAAHTDYRGHTYFFCSDECRQQFVADPTHYVLFRPNV